VPPWTATSGGIRLRLRVTPNAGADRIEGSEIRDDGTAVLRVRVAAVPDKGRANAAVIALLADALRIPKSAVTLTAGETARLKTIEVKGEPAVLIARLDALDGLKP
jgi:uncharacterized protein YggU (UPF0235/DUF167 family)